MSRFFFRFCVYVWDASHFWDASHSRLLLRKSCEFARYFRGAKGDYATSRLFQLYRLMHVEWGKGLRHLDALPLNISQFFNLQAIVCYVRLIVFITSTYLLG